MLLAWQNSALVNNSELRNTLKLVLMRLDTEPKTVDDWRAIQDALSSALAYTAKCRAMRAALDSRGHNVEEGGD